MLCGCLPAAYLPSPFFFYDFLLPPSHLGLPPVCRSSIPFERGHMLQPPEQEI